MNTYVLEITFPRSKRNGEDPFTKLEIQQADDPIDAIRKSWMLLRFVGDTATVRVFRVADEPVHAELIGLNMVEIPVTGGGPTALIENPMAALTDISGH